MIPSPVTWKEIDALRCRCSDGEVESVEGMPHCLRCKTCRGWWSMALGQMTDLAKIRLEFGEAKL